MNCSKKKKKKNTHTLTRHKIFGTRGYSSARDVRRPFIGTRVITPPEIRLLQLFPRHKILAKDGGHSSARHHCFGAVLCGLHAQISWQRQGMKLDIFFPFAFTDSCIAHGDDSKYWPATSLSVAKSPGCKSAGASPGKKSVQIRGPVNLPSLYPLEKFYRVFSLIAIVSSSHCRIHVLRLFVSCLKYTRVNN